MRIYKQQNVLEAAQDRIRWTFDRFENVICAVSSGKDSSVLAHLACAEAVSRNRSVKLMFLDQEAEYHATVEHMRYLMAMPGVEPLWYQVPIRMTNATSYEDEFLRAWWACEEWMREKEPNSIHCAEGAPQRFYPFFDWFEGQQPKDSCSLIGLRSEESLNRYRAVTKHPAIDGIGWSSKGKITKFYPMYDWTFEDVWAFIARSGMPYNKVYDWLYIKGVRIPQFRVSNLIHEKAFKCLAFLQEFEPETYERLVRRLKGVSIAARYAKEKVMFRATTRPAAFETWLSYRDYLLDTVPTDHKQIFLNRFTGQVENESAYRQQVKQLLINDWENNVPVIQKEEITENILAKWRAIL